MRESYALKIAAFFCVIVLFVGYMPTEKPKAASGFYLSAEERSYLNALKTRPITFSYSYDLVTASFDGKSYSMLDPILDVLRNDFGLTVNLLKANWHDAFIQIDDGRVDFYGPISLSEKRRQEYITVDSFYRSHSKIITRVSEPVNSMTGLYNKSVGLLEDSVISRTMQAYLGPKGNIIYYQTMDEMIEGLQAGSIAAFATPDNAEFEILSNDDIRVEFSIENFYVDQGFISGNEELRPLAALINRYLSENIEISDKVNELRNEAIKQRTKKLFADDISYLKANYNEISMFVEAILYPLCYEENGVIKGMQPEINDVFTELTGIPVRYVSTDDFHDGVVSATELLRTGTCLAAVGAYYSIDIWNDQTIQYSPLLWLDTIRTYSKYGNNGSLIGKKLGTTPLATDYLGWDNRTGNKPVINGSRKQLITDLKNGELDAVFIGELAFDYEYTINKDYSLQEVTGSVAEAAMHMMYGAQNKQFNAVYNESMNLYHLLKPKAMGEWKSKTGKFKSDYIRMRFTQQIWIILISVVFVVMLCALIFMMMKSLRHDKDTIALMKIMNEMDVLTGIYNRRYMDDNLDRTINVLSRSSSPLSVFMIDIDFFKLYNDTYGHSMGDDCLQMVAKALTASIKRDGDFVARYGGEEFAIILPHTDESGARIIADEIFESIKELNIPHEGSSVSDRVSVSIGITTGIAAYTQSGMDYLRCADKALYISKRGGRNRYTFIDLEETAISCEPKVEKPSKM